MSFSAEMKDFIGAYEKGQKINASRTDQDYKESQKGYLDKKTKTEFDPERLKLQDEQGRANLAKTNAGIGLTNEHIKNAGVSRGYTAALTKRINDGPAVGGVPDTGLATAGYGGGAVGAAGPQQPYSPVPLTPQGNLGDDTVYRAEGGAIPDRGASADDMVRRGRTAEEKDRDDSTRFAARMATDERPASSSYRDTVDYLRKPVKYAEGGTIPELGDDEEEEPAVGPEPAVSGPAVGGPAVGGTSDTTDISARRRGPQSGLPQGGYNGIVSPALVGDAVRGGYQYGAQALGKGARGRAAAQAIAQGAGALSPQEMEMARHAVDPEKKMTDSQRNMAALGSVYQFWANKGEPERAQKVAFQMIQHYRNATQRYAAIAAHAADIAGNGGDKDGTYANMAAQAAMKAYANVPDGKDMRLQVGDDGKIAYTYTDENGKTITKGLATPQEIGAAAMGLVKGGFDKALLSAAGQREEASGAAVPAATKGAGGGKANREAVSTTVNDGIEAAQKEWQAANKGKELNEKEWNLIKDAATHIAQQNENLTGPEVVRAARELAHPADAGNKYRPEAKFRVVGNEGGVNTIKMSDGTTVRMSDEMLDPIMNRRAEAVKSAGEAEKAAAEEAAKPTWGQKMDKYWDAGDEILAKDWEKFKGEVPTELKERGKSALNSVKRAVDGISATVPAKELLDYDAFSTAVKKGIQGAIDAVVPRLQNRGAIPDEHDAPM